MSRSFRVYQKKRGHRRTGSGTIARVWEALFFGLFFLVGVAGLSAMLVWYIIPEWQVNYEFVQTTCVVLGKELVKKSDDGRSLYRPEIAIEYQAGGTTREAKTYDICGTPSVDRDAQQAILDQFEVGGQYACWYDPANPQTVVLVQGYTWWIWLLLILPVSFLIIGAGGFIYRALHWGKSAERRAATGPMPIKLRALDANGKPENDFPKVPPPTDMTNSPGTTLRFRLPISGSATIRLLVLLTAAILWNAVVGFFLFDVVQGFLEGRPNWVETIVIILFTLSGLLLIGVFFRQLLVATGVGPTLLEISDHPLYPGRTYEVFLSQAGRLRMCSLELLLVGTEEVRYRQGTDTRTETRCIHRQSLFCRERFEIQRGVPFEVRATLNIPDTIMHSFRSANNRLIWSLVAEGKVDNWPDYERAFPVIIYPQTDPSPQEHGEDTDE